MIKKILNLLETKDKKNLSFVIVLSLFAAFFEILGISSLIPLIEFFSDQDVLGLKNLISSKMHIIKIEENNLLIFLILIVFACFLFKNLFLAFFYFIESKFVMGTKANLINNLYEKYLFQNYSFHVNNNSSKLITNLNIESDIFVNCISFLITILVEVTVIFTLSAFIFFINPKLSIILFLFSFFFSIIMFKIFKNRTLVLGGDRVKAEADKQKNLQQSLDGIKEIIIFNNRNFFLKKFTDIINEIKIFLYKFEFINKLQKILIEELVIIILVIFIIFMSLTDEPSSSIMAYLAIYLIAAIKLLPSINKIAMANNYLRYALPSIIELNKHYDLKLNKDYEKLEKNQLNFNSKIELKSVSFSYPKFEVLHDINLEINKNEFVGILGETGSGKSTLSNLLLGLIKPSKGKIFIDEKDIFLNLKSYHNKIGYVPQNIFLLDDSIKNNIGFGIKPEDIDNEKLNYAVEQSSLTKLIKKMPNGIDQIVGEKGMKISGGEKQRIGIARALYRNPELLILDEPTTSLDDETEKSIIKEILNLKNKLTVFLITHKKQNLLEFSRIYKVDNKRVTNVK